MTTWTDVSPASPLARSVRAGSFGVGASLVAAAAHLVAGGTPPPVAAVALPVLGTTAAAWFAAASRMRFGTVLGLLAAPQLAVHLLTGYVHGHVHVPSAGMLVVHLLAVAAVAWGLARVERSWWSAWGRLDLVRSGARPAPHPTADRVSHRAARPVLLAALRHVRLRGPPGERLVPTHVASR